MICCKNDENPMFRSQFAQTIFNQKYRHEGCETWEKLAETLVHDVCGPDVHQGRELMSKEDRDQLVAYVRDLKFIPGGRYLYYAGRKRKFFNNCLVGSTKILTDEGWKTLDSFSEGESTTVYSPVEGCFLPATVHCHGEQEIYQISFANLRGNPQEVWSVKATRDHRWMTARGETTELQVGDVVPAAAVNLPFDRKAFSHGLVFADGSKGAQRVRKGGYHHQLRLCGAKASQLDAVDYQSVSYPEFANGDPVCYVTAERDLKELPDENDGVEYIASFIRGWVAFDGHQGGVNQIHSINKEHIEFFVKYAPLAGYIVTGHIRCQEGTTNYAKQGRKPLWRVNFKPASEFPGFKVVKIIPVGKTRVYCPFEPKHNRITIEHGIDTFNCFLLKAEEDTREDWAALSQRVESCLMTGGGIGVDYTVYRPKNSPLSATGGIASGPIPKMLMINEIGRNVIQGGARRSAIYASLNWKHGDIHDFLKVKNWHDMPIPGTKSTFAEAKQVDFNFPCPLDGTNISVNYDTEWLLSVQKHGLDPVFLKNVEQALATAEPGFSFNFFANEKETLRNACTEVTSEDDSDVCNLGSVNMGRIESLEEFQDVVELATKFLVCGTLKAELPYDRVYKVREKNRRLGLGLMGIHEWLLKRKYRYEVVPELHTWLGAYQHVSDTVADRYCFHLSISRCKAKRAIAPTGSIALLAGTSTGIEPIFATAYKRRYLKEGSKWHYQYVVDSAAQELIELYGLDPNNIESALDLAADYERRIKFQADVQRYVDMSISSTINLPKWGSKLNNPDTVGKFAETLAKYAQHLRGFTCYPDGARGGQPLTSVPYEEAVSQLGTEFEEAVETHDICSITGHGGSCGV